MKKTTKLTPNIPLLLNGFIEDGFIPGFIIGLILGGLVIGYASEGYWHRQTIWHHAAHYDATSGDWQWNTTNTTFTP
jgi:hypothetical protein